VCPSKDAQRLNFEVTDRVSANRDPNYHPTAPHASALACGATGRCVGVGVCVREGSEVVRGCGGSAARVRLQCREPQGVEAACRHGDRPAVPRTENGGKALVQYRRTKP